MHFLFNRQLIHASLNALAAIDSLPLPGRGRFFPDASQSTARQPGDVFETLTYSEFFNVLRLLRAILPGPSRDWEPDFAVRTRRLIDGSLQSGRLMKRRLPDGTVEYRAMTESEHREAAADDTW